MNFALQAKVDSLEKKSEEFLRLIEEVKQQIVSIEDEIGRIKILKRPDREPIKVPKPPMALQGLGVGLTKE